MRKFNITGSIVPELHYYVDLTPQLDKLIALAGEGAYFIINRPRQFGKTTMLKFFAQRLRASGNFAPALFSFQSFTQRPDITEPEFYNTVAKSVFDELASTADATAAPANDSAVNSRRDFFAWLGKICGQRKVVLLIDEVDAIPDNVVIGFLANLREMFLERWRRPAPHAVALAGVHDIKNLQARYRDEKKSLGSASPFNIAIDYVIPPFSRENIRDYYAQHTADTGQAFDEQVITRVHELTSGYPWLVSVLAKRLVEEVAPDRAVTINIHHLNDAVQRLLRENNTHFDSLIKHAYEPDLQPIVIDLLQGRHYPFTPFDPALNRLALYGVIRAGETNGCIIGNRIYEQVLFASFHRVMASQMLGGDATVGVVDAEGRLDFRRVLDKFQAFMKAKGAQIVRSGEFKEATGQLLLLSYLDLLVNGKGWTFKEVQSGEGRIDVVCCYKNQKEIVELKLWYGEQRYDQGLNQLVRYLESESLDHVYLVVFDRREVAKEYTFSEHQVEKKKIFAWVV
jgi:hypothetical protein